MQLSQNFSLAELTRSDTAARYALANVPDAAGIAKLRLVCEHVLEPVRAHFGRPVHVNSGYRSPAVNAKVPGSSNTSQHTLCEAVDFEVTGVSNDDVAKWIAGGGLVLGFDQLIREFRVEGDPASGWVHCSWSAARRRREVLTAARVRKLGMLRTVYSSGLVLQ